MSRQLHEIGLTILLATIVACGLGRVASAQATITNVGDGAELPVVKITSVPQAEPDPPLKYQLTPAYSKLQPGNAATSYYRAVVLLPRAEKQQFGDEQSKWLDMALTEFPKEEARKWLGAYVSVVEELHTATVRESCDWNHRPRELKGMATIAFLLPELQEARSLGRVLRVKARLEIAEGQFDQALSTITMGYRLAENTAQSPILISDLVGIAIAQMMNDSLRDFIEAGGPNLYWALAGLPNPLVDIRPALQQEMNLPVQMFPFLEDPENATHTPEQWRQIIADSMQQLANLDSVSRDFLAQTMATGLILAGYAAAKQQLIESGMDPAKVEAMPVGQVVAIQSAKAYRKVYQESLKWTLHPLLAVVPADARVVCGLE